MRANESWAKPHSVANSIRMLRAQHRGAFLVVEGDSDARYYRSLVDTDKCHIQIAQGKQNVIGSIEILNAERFSGVLGVIDSDYSAIIGPSVTYHNIVVTDSHDLETMILSSGALTKVLSEFASHDKLQKLASQGVSVEATLVTAARPVGCLRLLSQMRNLSLRFQGVKFEEFVDPATLEVDVTKMIATVKNLSNHDRDWEPTLPTELVQLMGKNHDPWHLCCGHDVVALLSIALTSMLGNAQSHYVHPKKIESSLRLAYEHAQFGVTRLFAAISNWEKSNPPFIILR